MVHFYYLKIDTYVDFVSCNLDDPTCEIYKLFLLLFLLERFHEFFFFFRATPSVYGGFQARG